MAGEGLTLAGQQSSARHAIPNPFTFLSPHGWTMSLVPSWGLAYDPDHPSVSGVEPSHSSISPRVRRILTQASSSTATAGVAKRLALASLETVPPTDARRTARRGSSTAGIRSPVVWKSLAVLPNRTDNSVYPSARLAPMIIPSKTLPRWVADIFPNFTTMLRLSQLSGRLLPSWELRAEEREGEKIER